MYRAVVLLAVVLATACAPQAQQTQPSAPTAAPAAQGPKVLTIAMEADPKIIGPDLLPTGVGGSGSGGNDVRPIVHDVLSIESPPGNFRPQMAAEFPSVEKGTWKINPDGTMDTIWTLRPNIKWHDGTPFTSADVVFTFDVTFDPYYPPAGEVFFKSAQAIDAQTFLVRWSRVYAFPYDNATNGLASKLFLPKHLLEEVYQRDKDALAYSPLHSDGFIGTGPYRLTRWERGSEMEFVRFDDYYQGRPPFDRVIVKVIPDYNSRISQILAGAVDVVVPTSGPAGGASDLDSARSVQERWQGTGNQVQYDVKTQFEMLQPQLRPEFARPVQGMPDRAVREALYRGIDRQQLSEILAYGLKPVADSWIPPNDALRPQVEASVPKFPYDMNRAQQLLTQAGWVKGADGYLVNQRSGETFEIELRGPGTPGIERELTVIADGWKPLGVRGVFTPVPPAMASDREYRATLSGFHVFAQSSDAYYKDRLRSDQTPTAANAWRGNNIGGYQSPRTDEILARLTGTIDQNEQLAMHRQLLEQQMGDIPVYPLYWTVEVIFMLKGVTGPQSIRNLSTANFFDWDRR
jgi:peptide/nickel transport system substrate-binding protein